MYYDELYDLAKQMDSGNWKEIADKMYDILNNQLIEYTDKEYEVYNG